MVAGEASGDLLASLLLGGMRTRWPDLTAQGIGGPKMAAQGFESWWPHHKLAVRGYVEVLLHYREIVGIRKQLAARLMADKPDAFVGIDAPDFNLDLEGQLKRAGVKTIHFVSPSIWAWRGERIGKIGLAVDHVLCVFPFEPMLYAQHGIAATYVGHPLADAIPLTPPHQASRQALGLAEHETMVALLPGSRRSEIQHVAPRLLAAAARMHRERAGLKFMLPVAPGLRELIEPLVRTHAGVAGVELIDGRSHAVLAASSVALVASGTATLEAALFKRPMVIAYVMNSVSWQMMKRMRYQPWVGLPNILLEDFAVPELLQSDATPARLAQAALDWMDRPAACEALAKRFESLHHALRRNTALAATDAIETILET